MIHVNKEAARKMAQCSRSALRLQALAKREVRLDFGAGRMSSEAGVMLLREVEQRTGIIRQLSQCFTDARDPKLVEHPVARLVAQRVFGLALGYEDLNDHDQLRRDPLLAAATGCADLLGAARRAPRDRGQALAGKSTLNRLELAAAAPDSRYKKIVADAAALGDLLVQLFIQLHPQPPGIPLILDIDATDIPLHGHQEGRFFHGYYDEYCYLPLYVCCGDWPLAALLRLADGDGAAGVTAVIPRLVTRLRAAWPDLPILVRGDSGFCRDALLTWCETNKVQYVIGLARNPRLERWLAPTLAQAEAQYQQTRTAARVFAECTYQTQDSWACARRVIGKAEHLPKGANPRFVVTNLPMASYPPAHVYEQLYCPRGGAGEQQIREQQLYLFATRTSSYAFRANQLRLYFSTYAYLFLVVLRHVGLRGTVLARATCQTLRLRLLKLGALITVSTRRVLIQCPQAAPDQALFRLAVARLQAPASG